jgi:hypothetical protein
MTVAEYRPPCRGCTGQNGVHYLTCRTLRLPLWMFRGWSHWSIVPPADQLERAYGRAYGRPGEVAL